MKTASLKRPINILMVEDNPGDVRLVVEVFKEARVRNNVIVVKDGEQALDYLFQRAIYAGAIVPDLVLLDINLPRINGLEVLKEMKADARLNKMPVVILTSSDAERDILKSYDLFVNAYVTKPVGFDQFVRVVQTIEGFWLEIAKLPVE
jgi:CheY-like chemotaxis protein